MARRLPEFLSWVEGERLLQAAAAGPERFRDRDRFIVSLGLFCGLRCAEMTSLRSRDVDVKSGTIFVYRGKGRKDRYVPIPARVLPFFQTYMGSVGEFVLPSHRHGMGLHPHGLRYVLGRVGARAGFARRCHPHQLRHTYATSLLESGADLTEVQELLGHESISTTAIYLHCLPDRLRPAVDRLGAGRSAPQLRLFGS